VCLAKVRAHFGVRTTASVEEHRSNSRTARPVGPHPHNVYRLWELQAGLRLDLSSKVEHAEAEAAAWVVDGMAVKATVASDSTVA